MTSTRRRGLIDIEIDAQKEKVRKIKEDNRIFDTLETDKNTLDNEKKKWFFTRKTFFLYSIHVYISLIVHC